MMEDYPAMADAAQHAIRIEEGNAMAHYLLGKANNEQGDGIMSIAHLTKAIVLDLLTHYPAFQINFYNTLSTFAQNTKQQLWQIRRTTEEERFRAFLQRRSLRPAGKKTLHIRMEDLAVELGVTRLRVSQMLARLASQGKLTTSRGVIEIPALETL